MSGVPDAAIAACPDYEAESCRAALRQVLAPFGGLAWVKPGMRIAVKANLVSAMKPERAATTHPMLLRVLTEELVRRGASVVVGDSPGGTYAAGHLNAVYRACGLAAVEEAGGTLNRNFAQREADLPDARVAKHITYTPIWTTPTLSSASASSRAMACSPFPLRRRIFSVRSPAQSNRSIIIAIPTPWTLPGCSST